MMIFAFLAAAGAQPQMPARNAIVQATATVRILAGARVEAGRLPEEALVRKVQIERSDGTRETAQLVEFQ
jgi:hypothetical protein